MDTENLKEKEILTGIVEHVVYHNEENGYAVFRVAAEDSTVVVVGNVPYIGVGEGISARGVWIRHPSYGEQFKASSTERTMPAGEVAILHYLASGNISGIGPVTAKRIVESFKDRTFDILESKPEELAKIKGMTLSKAKKICESFGRQLGIRKLMEYLIVHGITPHVAIQMYKYYGSNATEFLKDNPYIITEDLFGVAFHLADELASELGFVHDSPLRVEAGVLYELRYNSNNGHVFIPRDKLALVTSKLLSVDAELCYEAVDRLVDNAKIIREEIAGEDACYLVRLHEAEEELAERLMALAAGMPISTEDIGRTIDIIKSKLGVEYAPLQCQAISSVLEHSVFLLTGGPGTGKSTSVRGMLELFDTIGLKTVLCSPTGRAAQRLGELSGREATTIHRLLEVDFSSDSTGFTFIKDEDEPIEADAVILDETSMVDVVLMNSLVRALKSGARLIMVGDPDQLPSVGPGNVLKDLISSGAIATVCLTDIFRQAQDSNIVMAAHNVNRGLMPQLRNKSGDLYFVNRANPQSVAQTIVELVTERLPAKMGYSPDRIQVISPTRRGVAGTYNLNLVLQEAINPPAPGKPERRSGEYLFRTGDRVMHIRNNYDLEWYLPDGSDRGMGVFNGDVGIITEIDMRSELAVVRYDEKLVRYPFELLGELEPAYAMTVHKSQGSEYPAVLFVASRAAPQLLNRSVFYTAITRAQGLLVIVGDEEVVASMVQNNRRSKRYSGLRYRLSGEN